MRESRVWTALEGNAPPWLKLTRFEVMNPPGTSDVFWTDQRTSISGWIELKYCEPNDREFVRGCIPKMRPDQPMFLRRQVDNGCPSGILLRVGPDSWFFWKAGHTHEWIKFIRSDDAFTKVTHHHAGKRPPIDMIWAHLLGSVPL